MAYFGPVFLEGMVKSASESTAAGSAVPGLQSGLMNRIMALGPGFVYVLTILGTGDLISNSAAGGEYGYALIWALGLTLIFRFVWVNTSAKYVLVTGETLMQGYARLGNWFVWLMLIALIILRHFYNLYQVVMMGSGADLLFHLPTAWSSTLWALLFTAVGFTMMFWGGYSAVELFCKILVGTMGGSMIVAALLSNPDPAGILKGMFIPSIPGQEGLYSAFLILMALVGTEAGSMTNLTYAYFIHQKGWTSVAYMKQQRFDLGFGVICLFLMGTLLQVAAAGTVREQGVALEGAEDLVRIFSESQGRIGLIIFGLGLWGAAFSTFVGGTVGYSLIITDLCRNFIPRFKQAPEERVADVKRDPIYRWTIVFWSLSPVYIVFTGVRPVWLVLTISSFMVIMIPVLALALVKITNDRSLMGSYKNNWFTNTILFLLVAVALYFTGNSAIDLWHDLMAFLN